MKRGVIYLSAGLLALLAVTARPALAQTEMPPPGSTGKVVGRVINQNTGTAASGELEVMLHILDQAGAEAGMLHGLSLKDGSFRFEDVPFNENFQYAVMANYEGVTYFSDTVPVNMASLQVALDVPVYESTVDLANVLVDQMHVLFKLAEDGLETREIYILSNSGERTVKDVYKLEGDITASVRFPLPSGADYIFFNPNDRNRFVKFNGGFADTYPVLPGTQSAQIMVSYLVPYINGDTYTYTAPLKITRMNFLIEEKAGVSLQSTDLTGPERMTFQNGTSYLTYSISNLNAGQTVEVTFLGQGNFEKNPWNDTTIQFAGVLILIGLATIGIAVWWWRRSENSLVEDINGHSGESTLDEIAAQIARLDDDFENGDLGEEEHQRLRRDLVRRAKHLL